MRADEALAHGLSTHAGQITNAGVAEAFGAHAVPVAEILSD
jgi:alanine dehydrogenase